MLLEFELVWLRDFMLVLVICKFDEDHIKTEGAIVYLFSLFSLRENNGTKWSEKWY